MEKLGMNLIDPVPDAEWEIWYQDTFDRECPRQVEIAGLGLVKGLIELWSRHLFETVQANGRKGFSRFNLWWKQEGRSIEVVGEWVGSTRLREWVFGDKQHAYTGYEEGDKELLMKVAVTHSNLVLAGQTSEAILLAARASASREDFEARLLNLEGRLNQTK
jgi:hypothetical protein